jgi:hypothetical protein
VTDDLPDIGALLTRTLHERAREVPDSAGLADRARREAGQVRRRRLATGAGALALVVMAVLLPQAVGGQRLTAPPAQRVANVDLVTPPGARTIVGLDKLPAGPSPSRSWLDGRLFHRTDGRVVPMPDAVTVAVEYGFGAIAYRPGPQPEVYVLGPSGAVRSTTAGGPPVTGRHGQVAYVDLDARRLEVLWPGDPAGSWGVSLPDADRTTPIGFLLDRSVVVDRGQTRGDGSGTSIVTRDGIRAWHGMGTVTATYAPGRALAVVRHADGQEPCLELWPTPRDPGWWRHCPAQGSAPDDQLVSVIAFGADSHHVVIRGRDVGGRGTKRLVVADRTGRVVRELDADAGSAERFGQAVFESGDHVLLAVWEKGRSAIVRCNLDGHCETATEPRVTALEDWQSAPFGAGT